MADVITRLKVESSEYDAKIKRAAQSLNEMSHAAEVEGNKIATANKENLALVQSLGKMQTVASSARGKMGELSSAIESATIMYNRLSAAEKQGQFGKALNASITQLQGRLKSLQGEMAAVQGGMGKVGGGGFGASMMQGMGSAFSMLGPAAIAAGGAAAAISGVKAAVSDYIRINKEFEQASANLASVMGKTRDETTKLTDQAKKLGAATRYTAVQITELQTNLAKLGFSESEILNSTKAVQNLATATGSDLGSAADLAGAALRSFGLNATEMDRVTSVLAVSTTKSALSFDKLQAAMPIVGSAAAKMGFSIEDTVTLLGKLVDTGMDASTAATALRNIFLKMADPTSKMSEAIGGNIHSLDDLAPALMKCKEQGMSLGEMFGIAKERGTVAFATLVEGSDQLLELRDSLNDCSDALQGMVDEMDDTAEGASARLSSAWEGMMLSIGNTDAIKDAKNALADLLGYMTKVNEITKGGDSAIGVYEQGLTADVKKRTNEILQGAADKGISQERINELAQQAKRQNEDQLAKMESVLAQIEDARGSFFGENEIKKLLPEIKSTFGEDIVTKFLGQETFDDKSLKKIYEEIAKQRDKIAQDDYIISATTTSPQAEATGEQDIQVNVSLNEMSIADLKQKLKDVRDEFEHAYSQEERDAADKQIKEITATIEKLEGKSKEAAKATKEVFEEGSLKDLQQKLNEAQDALARIPPESDKWADALQLVNDRQKAVNDLQEQIKGKTEETAKVVKDAAYMWGEHTKSIDEVKSRLAEFQAMMTDMSLSEEQRNWAAGMAESYQAELNKMLGATEEVSTSISDMWKESLDKMSSGVGAISTIGNAFNDLKGIGEDLTAAFSGEMDAWDALMTVFNSGISIMQTVIGVMEAINTLQELSSALSKKKVVDQGLETAAVVTGKSTEAAATTTEMGVEATATGITAGKAAASAGDAVAGIPIVGPILAVAAVAAVLAAILASVSKAKSSTKGFATGGIVPGNSYSGDNLRTSDYGINSGELILNKAQQGSIASQLTGNNPMQNLQLSTEISGTNLRIVLNNDNRSKGGSRGYYANIH